MVKKILKKVNEKKVIEKKFDSVEIIESKGSANEKITSFDEGINNQKFLEFLNVSNESIETLASKKPKNARTIERDSDILSINLQEENSSKLGQNKEKQDYFARTSEDYALVSPREEKKQDISNRTFQPQRVNIQDLGREMRMPLRENFMPNSEMNRLASPRDSDGEEKKYDIERVDFTDIGREKRYKLMK